MKKILTTLLLLLAMTGLSAQGESSPWSANLFLSGQGGVSFYHNKFGVYNGFAGGIGIGKWIVEPLALRVSLDLATNSSPRHLEHHDVVPEVANYTFASADFLWDFNATFSRVRNWRVHFYPMVGLGFGWRDSLDYQNNNAGVDREAHVMFGGQANVRLGRGWMFFLESKIFLIPQGFDGSHGDIFMNMTTLGITRNFFESPFHRRTEFESRSTGNDWFFGFGIGPNISSYDLMYLNPKYGMWGIAPEFMLGRNLTEFWTIRFELNGISAHERYDTVEGRAGNSYTFSNLHADLMVNLTHALRFTRGVRFNVLPYLGAGMVWRYDDLKFDMAPDFGVMCRYYLGRRSDIYVDLKYIMTPAHFAGAGPSGKYYSAGIPSLTFGYIYNFGTSTTRYRQPLNWCPEP